MTAYDLLTRLLGLQKIHSVDDARTLAKRRLPAMVFDYVDGAAGDGRAEQYNRDHLQAMRLRTRVLRDVEVRSLKTTVMGKDYDLPFGIAPMGFGNLVAPGADTMLAKAAARHNMPMGLSTAATTALEEIAKASSNQAWFQLYYTKNRDTGDMLIDRAEAAGYDTLVFTVDVPEVGRRPRELQHNFTLPFRPNIAQAVDCALHPVWSFKTVTKGPPTLANFGGKYPEFDRKASRAGGDWNYLAYLRDRWKGKLVVKGVLDVDDAMRLKETGVDAIQVSSHGGRQLQSAPYPIDALRAIRQAVGPDMTLLYDSGIRSGEDIIKAYANGADFVFLGRPFLYAIAADGERGLHILIDVLRTETSTALAMIGATSMDGLGDCLA